MYALLIAAAFALAAPAEPLELALPAAARTPGARIRLADLFPGAALLPELAAIDLGRAPSPGFGKIITRAMIEAALPPGAAALSGAMETKVELEVARVDASAILAAAERVLRAGVSIPAGAELEVVRRPLDATVPKGRGALELRPRLARGASDRGTLPMQVDVAVDGEVLLMVPVAFRLRTFENVLVLARDLDRGAALRPGDVATRRVETTERVAPSPLDAIELVGRIARRPLRAGEILSGDDFVAPVLVLKNETVTLVYRRGALRAESFGIARESGALGQVVRVENLTSKKRLAGRVTGPGVVEMNPEATPVAAAALPTGDSP